jgi:hypothetical protein
MTGLPKRYLFDRPAQWRAGLVTSGLLGAGGLTPAAVSGSTAAHLEGRCLCARGVAERRGLPARRRRHCIG